MPAPLRLSLQERDRIVAEAMRMRSEAIADMFRGIGRGLARLFWLPATGARRLIKAKAGRPAKASPA